MCNIQFYYNIYCTLTYIHVHVDLLEANCHACSSSLWTALMERSVNLQSVFLTLKLVCNEHAYNATAWYSADMRHLRCYWWADAHCRCFSRKWQVVVSLSFHFKTTRSLIPVSAVSYCSFPTSGSASRNLETSAKTS